MRHALVQQRVRSVGQAGQKAQQDADGIDTVHVPVAAERHQHTAGYGYQGAQPPRGGWPVPVQRRLKQAGPDGAAAECDGRAERDADPADAREEG